MKFAPFLLLAASSVLNQAIAQAVKPAPVLSIDIESIKEGKDPAHEKLEADYAAAVRKNNSPAHYVALAARSGTDQVWFVQPMPSFAINEEYDKALDKEPLKGTLDSLMTRDGELRTGLRTMWAVYRPDLSYKPESLNLAKTRWIDVATYQIKLGKDDDLLNGVQAMFGDYAKGHVDACILAYQVTAGAPAGTFLFFEMMGSMKVLDGIGQRATLKVTGDALVSVENTLLEVKPGMSYVEQSVTDADPDFWKSNTTAPKTKPTIPGPAEQKQGK